MKLLQINVTSNWGSTGRIVEDIGKEAIERGITSFVAYGRNANNSISNTIRIGTIMDIYVHYIQTRLLDRQGLASVGATKDLVDEIIKIAPDIIHLHNIHGYYLNFPILFKFLAQANIPVIWTLHDCWSFTGHCTHYSFIGCKRWQTSCHNCPQRRMYPKSLLFDRSRKNFVDKLNYFTSMKNLTLVTVSQWLASEIAKSFLKKYPTHVIHNGVDTEVFTPMIGKKNDFGIAEHKFVILGVASVWSPRKGLQDFFYLRQYLSADYIIILIGLDKKQIESLPKGIIGLQRTNSINELAKYYSIADVYLNTSVEETFGLTTVESLSCGVPAIVYNSTACTEVISKETGIVVEPHDIKGIARVLQKMKINEIIFDPQKCRERAVCFFNKNIQYSKYINLYNSILKLE